MSEPISCKRVPTLLLTGFLGAGKTTLLNRLIPYYQSVRTVLLINEFGQVGIDGELLVAGNYHKFELNKGSLFCHYLYNPLSIDFLMDPSMLLKH